MEEKIEWLPYDEEALDKCIGEISEVNGCIACGFFIDDRLIKISKRSLDTEYEVVLSRAGDIVLTAKKVALDLHTGLGIITIELSDKKTIIVPTECGTLAILTKKDINLGMLRLVIARTVENIKKKEEIPEEEASLIEDELSEIENINIDANSLRSMIEKEGLSHLLNEESPEIVITEDVTEESAVVIDSEIEDNVQESFEEDHSTEYLVRGIIMEIANKTDVKIRKLQITIGEEMDVELSCNLGLLYRESKISEIKSSIEEKVYEELNKRGMNLPMNLVVKRVL